MKSFALAALAVAGTLSALTPHIAVAEPIEILFVGNSYTFGRVAPVLGYNAANVHDLTAAFNDIDPSGTNSYPVGTPGQGWYEPHPWGGVPGIFKQMTVQAGLDYDVSLSTRNAATLRGHFLNTANSAVWDLRGNVASKPWDVVVLQERSDGALPDGRGANADLATFNAYADQFESYIHTGAGIVGSVSGSTYSYTETQLFGSLAACQATGLSSGSCNRTRSVPVNANANPDAQVYLMQTFARPDMVEAHLDTLPDDTTANGAPIIDPGGAGGAAGTPATLYYDSLAAMTADLHTSFAAKAASNPGFAGVLPVGDAFQLAVDSGLVRGSGFYGADGLFFDPAGGPVNLWWDDRLHASVYGSYLSALVSFGSITGLDPRSLGGGEIAAADLGIAPGIAFMLQGVAAEQLGFTTPVPEPASALLLGAGIVGLLGWRRTRSQTASQRQMLLA